jgi:hypothetical protein
MTIARVGIGPFHNVFNGANAPTPPIYSTGNKLLFITGEHMGSDLVSTPGGWTLMSPNNLAKQIACYGLDAAGGDTIPPVYWGSPSGPWSWTILLAYSGLASVATAFDVGGDRQVGNSTKDMQGGPSVVTPSQNGSLVLFVGSRNKTSTSDGSTFTAPANFTVIAQQTQSGTRTANVVCEWIQTTASSIPANSLITGSVADLANQAAEGFIIVLKPAATTFAPPPPNLIETLYPTTYVYD